MRIQASILLGVLALLGFISKAFSIKCVQCTTLVDKGCEKGYLPATECKPEEQYCLTYTGTVNAGFVIFRGCNHDAMQDKCIMKKIENQQVRTCYETCNFTACNGAYAYAGSDSVHMRIYQLCPWLPFVLPVLRYILHPYIIT